jgi:hypothetical protein
MNHRSSSPSMRFSFAPLESGGGGPAPSFQRAGARPDARRPRHSASLRAPVARPPSHERTASAATLRRVVVGALAWLLLGCGGLMWVIAFTTDIDSLVLALAVWVLAFVGPSLCATSLAYRLDDDEAPDAPPEVVEQPERL